MTLGLGRFEYYLIKLDDALLAASKTVNPALYLYQNNTRTTVFMLEALSKLYASMHNEKKFEKLKEYFKALEDALGDIDHYDTIAKTFFANKKIPRSIVTIVTKKATESITTLNQLLLKKKLINQDPLRTNKIRKRLKKMDWQDPKNELLRMKNFYSKSITEINKFFAEVGENFTDIETQVHELRRKMRWLSIYSQALQGAIQYAANMNTATHLKKYLTKEIIKSPFNTLPVLGNNKSLIYVDKNSFLALSFIVDALGKLKDEGLKIYAIKEALQINSKLTEEELLKKAEKINVLSNGGMQTLLTKAMTVCKPFFEEDILNHLVTSS